MSPAFDLSELHEVIARTASRLRALPDAELVALVANNHPVTVTPASLPPTAALRAELGAHAGIAPTEEEVATSTPRPTQSDQRRRTT